MFVGFHVRAFAVHLAQRLPDHLEPLTAHLRAIISVAMGRPDYLDLIASHIKLDARLVQTLVLLSSKGITQVTEAGIKAVCSAL